MPKGIPNPSEMYGIYSRPWGFEVSITRNGKRHGAIFGAASYGGAELALMHARTWRDALVKSLPPTERRARAQKLRANNTTGIPGVFGLLSAKGKVFGWLAKTYLAHDQILRALFPVDGFGNAAQSMAIHERALQLSQMTGLAKVHPAEEAIRKAPAPSSATLAPRLSKSEVVRRNNSSGIAGVTFKSARPGHPGYWMAITYTAGKGTVSKAFSVAEHGNEKAKKLAVAERQRQLKHKRSESRS
jgi:hypothetical protein